MANPWETEPNELNFNSNGYECRIVRHSTLGHLCGYVRIPPEHPWYEKDYNSIDATAHGGITFLVS